MTVRVIPFDPSHLVGFEVQPWQAADYSVQPDVVMPGNAWTALVDGQAICSAGIVPVWPGRSYGWALLSRRAGPHMRELTRAGRALLDSANTPRVEMYVEAGFEAGHRWARLLGFECETPEPMRNYLPGGRAAFLYARVK